MPAHDISVPFESPWAAWTWGLSHCTDLELCSHRYQHAVRVCALQEDLSSLPYGDLTEVSRTQSSAPQQCVAAQMPTGLKLCQLWLHHIQVPRGLKGPRRCGESQALPSCILHLGPFLGDVTMGVTPAPLGLGSAWPLLGSLPVCLPSQGWFLATAASPPPRLACPPKTEAGGTALWLDAQRPLLALRPHLPRSVRVISRYLP